MRAWAHGVRRHGSAMVGSARLGITPRTAKQCAGKVGIRKGMQKMLEAKDISFAYSGGRVLYDGLSLQVAPGERVALCAPSGFGKTTLCRILAGYLKPTAGSVMADGSPLPLRGMCPVQLIGQHPENMVDPRQTMDGMLVEAGDMPSELLLGLGIRPEWRRRHAHELSGGELQRFCIARALACAPRYLVADESTAMFDAVTQARVWRFLMRWCEENGTGLVFVSHSPELICHVATRTIMLGAR